MNPAMEQRTAVFSLGDLKPENSAAGRQMDDSTRELPLIAGRFAGRQWTPEELRREAGEKPKQPRRTRRAVRLILGGMAAMALLIGSLMGEARLTALNDQTVTVTAELRQLRREQDTIRAEAAELDLSAADLYATQTLGMQAPRGDQFLTVESAAQDKATVLGVRRGRGFTYLWNSFLDDLGAYLHGGSGIMQ